MIASMQNKRVLRPLAAGLFCLFLALCFASPARAHGVSYMLYPQLSYGMGPYLKYDSYLHSEVKRPLADANIPFAGMNNATLPNAGAAYRDKQYDKALELLQARLEQPLDDKTRDEATLLMAKCYLRKYKASSNHEDLERSALLEEAEKRLIDFIQTGTDPFYLRESRGWLARVDYLNGREQDAFKYYLHQFVDPGSIFSEGSLANSIETMSYFTDWSKTAMEDLELYMDSPESALFIVNYFYQGQRNGDWNKILEAVSSHEDLFNQGKRSAELTLALMGVAFFAGDLEKALALGDKLPEPIPPRMLPELLWLRACCYYHLGDMDRAEQTLWRLYETHSPDRSTKIDACVALASLYESLHEPLKRLHAMVLHAQVLALVPCSKTPIILSRGIRMSFYYDDNYCDGRRMDASYALPYFLDVEYSMDQLRAYLEQYGGQIDPAMRHHVTFALAVRLARQERYQEAIDILEKLIKDMPPVNTPADYLWQEVPNYLERYKLGKKLHEDAYHSIKLTKLDRAEALYQYGRFLYKNPNRLFFNRSLWKRSQGYALRPRYGVSSDGSTPQVILDRDRRLRDMQEERWRAANLLIKVAESVGYTPVGRKAVSIAMDSLDKMTPRRFGREEEIESKLHRLIHWPWQIPEEPK